MFRWIHTNFTHQSKTLLIKFHDPTAPEGNARINSRQKTIYFRLFLNQKVSNLPLRFSPITLTVSDDLVAFNFCHILLSRVLRKCVVFSCVASYLDGSATHHGFFVFFTKLKCIWWGWHESAGLDGPIVLCFANFYGRWGRGHHLPSNPWNAYKLRKASNQDVIDKTGHKTYQ